MSFCVTRVLFNGKYLEMTYPADAWRIVAGSIFLMRTVGDVDSMKRSGISQSLLIAVVLSVIFTATYAAFGHTLLLRPFWMDEVHSWLLISDPDASHAVQSLQQGADYNPPVYYFVARAFSSVVTLNEHNLRMLSALLILSAAIGLAMVFARRMTWLAAVGCSLLLCSQEIVVLQSTEVRFYALWLSLLTWFCVLLTTGIRRFQSGQWVALALLAALIAGTHYFGVISVGIASMAFVVVRRFQNEAIIRAAIPMVAAVCVVAFCLPLLSGQKAVLTAPTWVKPATFERSGAYVTQFFPMMLLLVSAAIWLVGLLLSRSESNNASQNETGRMSRDSQPGSLASSDDLFVFGSLLLMPLVLIIFSIVIQPALVNRYAVAACLWLVPVLTLLLKTMETRKSVLVLVAGCVMFAFAVRHGSATWDFNLQESQELTEQLKLIPDGEVVLFENRIDFWMLQHRGPHQSWYQLDFETSEESGVSNLRLVQRDVGRAIQPLYPDRFPMKSLEECSGKSVYIVPYEDKDPHRVVVTSGRVLTNLSERILKASIE